MPSASEKSITTTRGLLSNLPELKFQCLDESPNQLLNIALILEILRWRKVPPAHLGNHMHHPEVTGPAHAFLQAAERM